jgi:hypothetical protein
MKCTEPHCIHSDALRQNSHTSEKTKRLYHLYALAYVGATKTAKKLWFIKKYASTVLVGTAEARKKIKQKTLSTFSFRLSIL